MTSQDEAPSGIEEWAQGNPLREWYAGEVWGKPTEDDDSLFEIMSLQVFQAGLSWHLILTKRDAFRSAFHGWSIERVAAMGPEDVERLRRDPGIVRNRMKIEACITNARVVQELKQEHGSFCNWFYRVTTGRRPCKPLSRAARQVQVHGVGDCAHVAHGLRPNSRQLSTAAAYGLST